VAIFTHAHQNNFPSSITWWNWHFCEDGVTVGNEVGLSNLGDEFVFRWTSCELLSRFSFFSWKKESVSKNPFFMSKSKEPIKNFNAYFPFKKDRLLPLVVRMTSERRQLNKGEPIKKSSNFLEVFGLRNRGFYWMLVSLIFFRKCVYVWSARFRVTLMFERTLSSGIGAGEFGGFLDFIRQQPVSLVKR
jgi:hypothetical protein